MTRTHPGLGEALRRLGLVIPNEPRCPNARADIRAAGISLSEIQSTWNSLDPISPTSDEDLKAYKAVHNSRQTSLLNLTRAFLRGGILRVMEGEFSLKRRSMHVVVRQVASNDN